MKVTTERLENCQVNIFVELDAAEVEQGMRQAARKISQDYNVPGYRRGKAPYATVLRAFGEKAIQQQMLDIEGQELYKKALDEIKGEYDPYEQGELQDVEWEPFRMKVLLPIQPETDLGDYRAVRVPFETEPVTDEQLVQRLGEIQQQNARWIPVDRPAAAGDQVVIDATGTTGSKEILKFEGEELILDEQATEPAPGFHEHLVGMTAGEEKLFPLLYPRDYRDEAVAGKAATFSAHVHAVKQKDVPPLDDELAMMVGTYDTLDELKAAVGQQLEAEGAERAKPAYLEKVLEAMIAGATRIEYPTQALDREAEQAIERLERNLGASGIKLDRYLQMVGKTRNAYLAEARPSSEKRLKIRLAMIEVSKKENLGVSMEEVEAEATRLSALLKEEATELRQALASPQGRLSLADDLLTAKVQERIVEIGRGEAPAVEQVQEVAAAESGPGDGTQPAPATEEPVPSEAALPAHEAVEAQDGAAEAGDVA